MLETVFYGSLILSGVFGLYKKFKRKPMLAKYYAETSEFYHKQQMNKRIK
jgi:hypothetical protein